MNLRLNIHFRRKPDGAYLATAVMVSGKSVRFYRTTLSPDMDPYAAYSEVAAQAVNYLRAKSDAPGPAEQSKEKTTGKLIQFHGVLPL